MRYVVLGAGAIGCYVGGLLAHGGARVSLVGRPRAVAALQEHGLRVTDLDGRSVQVSAQTLNAVTSLAEAPQDRHHPCVILLCVKGGATMDAAREIAAPLASTCLARMAPRASATWSMKPLNNSSISLWADAALTLGSTPTRA